MSTWQDLKNNPRLMKIYQDRCEIIRLTREFFWSNKFVETETPLAVKYPGQEPYLNPMPVMIHDTRSTRHDFFLHTSPEFSMKKLLAAGFDKIFQITKTFRDFESFGGNHNPEFTMIEWYRAPGSLNEVMDDTENLFKYIGEGIKNQELSARGGSASGGRIKDKTILLNQKWDRLSMKEVWDKYAGLDLDNFLPKADRPLAETIERLSNTAKVKGYQVSASDEYEDVFFKIFLNEIEPKLGIERPVMVYDYPAQMCSLSKPAADERYSERFELYIGGLEVANAFGELTDAKMQEKNLQKDLELRKKLGKATWPVDPEFIAALESGMGNGKAAGIALGVDRMVILFTGARDINEVIFNSVNDQLES